MAAERPLKFFTKLAHDCKDIHYWERLQMFKVLSNQRRMERYKIFYVWKSLNGIVPPIGFKWKSRDPTKLIYPKTHGSVGRVRTLQKFSLSWEGVRLFNCLPLKLRTFKGTKEGFKSLLDLFLTNIPDQPESPTDKPGGRNLLGDPSNSIPDWLRVLNLDYDDDLDDEECLDDEDHAIPPSDGVETSPINQCSSFVGPGLSPGHGYM